MTDLVKGLADIQEHRCIVPYYLRPLERRGLYGGTAELWSDLDEIRTSGEVSSRWLRNQNQFCGVSVFLVFCDDG